MSQPPTHTPPNPIVNDEIRCGAMAKSGKICHQKPHALGQNNNRCYWHGGATPIAAAAHIKHGKYSKYLPTAMQDQYNRAISDPELLASRHEIAVMDARLCQLLERVSEQLEQGLINTNDDRESWREIRDTFESRRRQVETEHKRLVAMQQMITVEQALGLQARLVDIVTRHVTDKAALAAIASEVVALQHIQPPRQPDTITISNTKRTDTE